MKITWASNAPWLGTGYGTQTQQVIERLRADGHEVAVAANAGLHGRPMVDPETDTLVFPGGADAYSQDVMQAHHAIWTGGDPGWIVTLFDVWPYRREDFASAPIASWVPVDHDPVPPKVLAWCREHPTIAMSQFGQRALAEQGVTARYAPHALDRSVWKPTPTLENGRAVRDLLGIPDDAFLVMINAANKGKVPPRKAWDPMFQALAVFMDRHPDAYLYLHTDPQGAYDGVDLIVLQTALAIDTRRVRVPDRYSYWAGLISSEALAAHYTASDVLLSTSMAEGFGLAVLESQACGTPVIVTDFSAQPELVGAGWKVKFQPYWDSFQAAWLAMPLVTSILAGLEASYAARGDEGLRQAALDKAAQYDADEIYISHWRPILDELAEKLTRSDFGPFSDERVTRQQRRAARRKTA